MRYGSVCSGIEAATVAWHGLGWEPAFFAEIDAFPSAVLAERFPGVRNLGDFTTIRNRWIRRLGVGSIDLLVGGTPCQSFSVAGLRGGLADARGNLALEFLALAKRLKPQWLIWENVPGVISSDQGDALKLILDTLNSLGYSIEFDVLDAQFFGVPQRRRRVFLVCHNIALGRKRKTPTFASTALTCLTDMLLSILAGHCEASSIGGKNSAWPSRFSSDGLRRRIELFGLRPDQQSTPDTTIGLFRSLLNDLDAALVRFPRGQNHSESPSEASRSELGSIGATRSEVRGAGQDSLSTSPSWRNIWGVIFDAANASTTSTATKETTESTIYICAEASLSIARHMIPYCSSCPNLFDGESSGLTALRAFTNYARQASADLFRQLGGSLHWSDFVRAAAPVIGAIERHLGDRAHTGTLFPVPSSLSGDPPPSRAARANVAGSLGGGSGKRGWCDDLDRAGAFIPDAARSLLSKSNLSHREDGDTLVAHTLRADGFDASEDGTGRGTPLVPTVAPTLFASTGGASSGYHPVVPVAYQQHGTNVGPMGTLRKGNGNATGGVPFIVNAAESCATESHARQSETARCLDSQGGFATNQGGTVVAMPIRSAVRRLTPVEYERLQGFPDDWTLVRYRGKPATDGPRYKALGNSFAVPVVRWIGERIALVQQIANP